MGWNRTYLVKSYLKSSLWVVPFIAIPIALIGGRVSRAIDPPGWIFLDLTTIGAQSLLQTIISATLSFTVFTFGFLLVAIQVASGQLTPRIIATTLLRDNVVRYVVGLFIFTLIFALSTLDRVDSDLNQLALLIAACFGVFSFSAFLYVIDYAARLLRPVTILTRLGHEGIEVIEGVYPDEYGVVAQPESRGEISALPDRIVRHRGASEILVAVNANLLKDVALKSGGTIELVPQVGEFVSVDEPVFHLYGGAKSLDDDTLYMGIAFGPERMLDQDPMFAFRVIVDIALRALSASMNDPTTAVLAVDQLHRLLRQVGRRNLRMDGILDDAGKLRLVLRTPNWEDFVHLSFTEIRRCGGHDIQIVRRFRSMADNLAATLPEKRRPALLREIDLLDREIARNFDFAEDIELARTPDVQGLGSHSGRRPRA